MDLKRSRSNLKGTEPPPEQTNALRIRLNFFQAKSLLSKPEGEGKLLWHLFSRQNKCGFNFCWRHENNPSSP